ncbi:MAG: glycosyltransferase family 4 protein [Acidimicrobiales bacterium]
MARILALTNMYPPHHLGGYELQCRDVLDRFRARGHACMLLTSTMRLPGVSDPPGERSVGTRRDLEIYWEDHAVIRPPWRERWRRERANQRQLRQALADADPDVISVWHMGAMSLGLLTTVHATGIPVVYVVCDDWPCYADRQDPWMSAVRRLPRGLAAATGVPCRVPDIGATGTFCFVSDATRRSAERGSRWRFPDATVVYSGIDTVDFPIRAEARASWSWRLLCVGRIDARKGVATAIDALTRLPAQATLDVVGRGDAGHLADLKRHAVDVGVAERVSWSEVPRADLKTRYRRADALLFPVTWEEPFGLVPLEAMACGTPVVATATGGSGEYLLDGWNCLRCAPGDPASLADAVTRLAADPALRASLARAGALTAAEFTVDRLTDALEAWHLAAAGRFAEGRPHDRPPIRTPLG